jgi:PHS family inorganic phosphate transporter-like MFS transporter
MPFWPFWRDPAIAGQSYEDIEEKRAKIINTIDDQGFQWQIWAVASSGFFTDSYNLFATNVILPSLGFVYWPSDNNVNYELLINIVTLAGSTIGALVFGYFADKFGRRKLYGLELIIAIVGTLGVAQASQGYDGNMSILGWILFWRLFMGIGIGAEYPLSAVITAE